MSEMYCLHCGDCCRRMSPLGSPCSYVVEKNGLWFCRIYDKRPVECSNHDFAGARFCPVGMDVLGLEYPRDTDKIREIIDTQPPRALRVKP